jgi:hypothetical protein
MRRRKTAPRLIDQHPYGRIAIDIRRRYRRAVAPAASTARGPPSPRFAGRGKVWTATILRSLGAARLWKRPLLIFHPER